MGVRLIRRGSLSIGLCPIHKESRPSFTIYPDQRFHCYGCQRGGDVIDLVSEVRGLDFRHTLNLLDVPQKTLASAHVRRATTRAPKPRFSPDKAVLTELALYQNWTLFSSPRGQPGRDYLAARGFDLRSRTLRGSALGYCPDQSLKSLAQDALLSLSALKSAGATIYRDRQYKPRFAGSITIADIAQDGVTAVHMSGRMIQPPPQLAPHISIPGEKPPLGAAGLPPGPKDRALYLTEGALDWLAFRSWGLDAIATLGGHKPDRLKAHIEKLNRTKIRLAFDRDKSGAELTKALLESLASETNLEVKIARLPKGAEDAAAVAKLYGKDAARAFKLLNE